jgi:hypothetical protein
MDTADGSVGVQGVQPAPALDPERFNSFAGTCSIALAVGGIAYSGAFVVFLRTDARPALFTASLLLAGSGFLSTVVAIAIYEHVRRASAPIALWGLVMALFSSAGSMVHGGYDLANLINPPPNIPELPHAMDPRGLLTFGLAAASLAVASWLISGGNTGLPRRLGRMGYVGAALLAVVYLGRLILLDPTNPLLLGAAAVVGVIVVPWWYVWLGLTLRGGATREAS